MSALNEIFGNVIYSEVKHCLTKWNLYLCHLQRTIVWS